MNQKAEDESARWKKKITRRQMLKGAGILAPATAAELAQDKGTIVGTVTYPWGRVKNAKVMVEGKSAFTDGDGRYEITGVAPGKCTVTAQAPFPGYDVSSLSVEVAGGEPKLVDFCLDFEKTVVHGHVHDQGGKPIKGATLSGVRCGKDMETTVTDEKGYFKFERASPGNQYVRVNAAGYMGQIRDFTAKKGEETELEFHLTRGSCKVHGTVLDKYGRPLRGEVFLSLQSGLILQNTRSNAETGYYEFSVMPGTYDLLANASEYQAEVWRGSISADTRVDFKLIPLSELPPQTPDASSY